MEISTTASQIKNKKPKKIVVEKEMSVIRRSPGRLTTKFDAISNKFTFFTTRNKRRTLSSSS